MAEKSTWVKLDRNILDWEWYKDNNTKAVFLHLILKANIKDAKFMGVPVHRGQLVTSYPSLSKELGISVKSVRTALNHLKRTGEVAGRTYHDFSVITIVNYDRYQAIGQANGQAKGRQRAGNGHQSKNIRLDKEVKNIAAPPANENRDWERDIPPEFVGRFQTEKEWKEFWGT